MRVLLVSKFLHHVGGVETYLRWQAHALQRAGHRVGVLGMTPPAGARQMDLATHEVWDTQTREYHGDLATRIAGVATSVWSPSAGAVMRRAIEEFNPDVVHFHSTCYQLTPAVVREASRRGVPTVLTTHEYKLVCTNQRLYDDRTRGTCMKCPGAGPLPKFTAPIAARCMKGSAAVSVVGATERIISDAVWKRADPLILAPSMFIRDLLVADGWAENRVEYLDLPWRPEAQDVARHEGERNHVVFLGRLSREKGADVLLEVWSQIAGSYPDLRLRFIGDGDERASLEDLVARKRIPRVDFLGRLERPQIDDELQQAILTAHPAQWHENSPFTVRESLMAGVPAVVSAMGGMQEMIGPETGRVVVHDDPGAWARALNDLVRNPLNADRLKAAVTARAMTDEVHLHRLEKCYAREVSAAAGGHG